MEGGPSPLNLSANSADKAITPEKKSLSQHGHYSPHPELDRQKLCSLVAKLFCRLHPGGRP